MSKASVNLTVPAAGRLPLRGPSVAAGAVGRRRSRFWTPASDVRVLAAGNRRQLQAALAPDDAMVFAGDLRVSSKALARLIEVEAPTAVADIDDDRDTTSTQSMETHELTLSLEYCFVQISRAAWWDDAVLRLPRWYAPGSGRES